MRLNQKSRTVTHEGGKASSILPIQELRRTVSACLLWEKSFYESGEDVAARIKRLVPLCSAVDVHQLAIAARNELRLRHAPLLLARELARHPSKMFVKETIAAVIQRADELGEFLAIYWADGKQSLAKQVKRGLAKAFRRFDEYQLAKYNRDGAVRLKDVLFMVHAKPKDAEQEALWKRLINDELKTPDTWEVALSAGSDKGQTFERLIRENKLGYMALLRNLRNMHQAGVSPNLVFDALKTGAAKSKALPFRFVAAARAVPVWEPAIDQAMQIALKSMDKLQGRTVILVDVSGSMENQLSARSDMTRLDAACALAALVRGICDDARIFSFSNETVEVPPRNGLALVDAIKNSQLNQGTYLARSLEKIKAIASADRTIVITDEQTHDGISAPIGKGYLINVSTDMNGVGYGQWTHINGFSESVVNYIQKVEQG